MLVELHVAAKLLAMYLRQVLNFSQHVDAIVATCNKRFYLLAQLKKQSLGISSVDTVYLKLSPSTKFCMPCRRHYSASSWHLTWTKTNFITDTWPSNRRACYNECFIELLIEALPSITIMSACWWKMLSINFFVLQLSGSTLPQTPVHRKTQATM